MSKTVDDRVVSMQFDNSNFEKNVSTTMSTLEKFKAALHLDGATKGMDGVQKAADKMDFSKAEFAATRAGFHIQDVFEKATRFLENDIARRIVDVGKKIANEFTIEPVSTGFSEFELKMGSVQTIMASTGEDLSSVNKYLEELNKYSDKTIYSFSDMTNNIGKFTNAGVKLEDAVLAIKGISNEAAVSGANAQEASRAMYNFSQALSAGYVKLIDWKSIENANMATVEFKDTLLETALAMGTVVKEGDMYRSTTTDNNGHVSDLFNTTMGFNDALSAQWMTTEVLTQALSVYATDVREMSESEKEAYEEKLKGIGYTDEQIEKFEELGKKAYDSAQDVKTFSMMMDTLKEAAQSGWAQTWEILIGDFEEGKALWTSVANIFGDIIGKSADARNSLLQGWKDSGGRVMLIESLKNAFEGLVSVIKPIKEAFREVFPPATSKQLVAITEAIKNFSEKLILSDEASEKVKQTFKGLFSLLNIGLTIVKSIVTVVTSIISHSSGLIDLLLNVTSAIGGFISKTNDAIDKSNVFDKIISGIVNTIGWLIDSITALASNLSIDFDIPGFDKLQKVLQSIWDLFSKIGSKIGGFFSAVGSELSGLFNFETFDKSLDLASGGLLTGILLSISKMLKSGNLSETLKGLVHPIEQVKGVLSSVTGILDDVRGCLSAWQSELKAKALLEIAAAIGILAISLAVLSTIDEKHLNTALSAITGLFLDLIGGMAAFSKIKGLGVKSMTSLSATMISMSIAILILASALKKIATLKPEQLFSGLIGVITLVGATAIAMKYLSKDANHAIKGATQMILFAVAVNILATAVKKLSSLNWKELVKGLGGTIVLLAAVTASAKILSGTKGLLRAGIGIIGIALGIKILASACSTLAMLNTDQLIKGLIGIAVLLGSITLAVKLLPNEKKLMSTGIAMIFIAESVKILASAVAKFGSLSLEEMAKGLLALEVSLVLLVGAVNLMPKNMMSIGVGLLFVSKSLVILSKALGNMGGMSIESIGKSMLALAGSLTILVVTLKLMQGTAGASASLLIVSSALMILSGSLRILGGMSLTSIIKSLATLAGTFIILGVAGAVLGPLVPAILGLGAAMALVGVGVLGLGAGLILAAAGFTALAASLSAGASIIAAGLVVIISGLINLIPTILVAIVEGIAAFAQALVASLPVIAEAIIQLISMICLVITETTPMILETVFTFIINLLSAIRDNIGEIVIIFVDTILNVIAAIQEKLPEIIQAAIDFMLAFIEGLGQGIEDNAEKLKDTIISFCEHIWNAFCNFFGIHSPSTKMAEAGGFLIKGLINGITGLVGAVGSAIFSLGKSIISGIGSFASSALSKGKELMGKLKDGISSKVSDVVSKAKNVASKVMDGMGNAFKKMKEIGGNLMDGLKSGISGAVGKVTDAVGGVCDSIIGGAKSLFGIHSPSRVFKEIGRYCDEGLAVGLEQYSKLAERSADDVGNKTINSISEAISQITDDIGDVDTQPVIRPVLDLSNIQNGQSQLYRMMDQMDGYALNGSTNLASSLNLDRVRLNNQENLSSAVDMLKNTVRDLANRPTEVTNNFDIQGDDPVQIANEVSRILQQQVERRDAVWG